MQIELLDLSRGIHLESAPQLVEEPYHDDDAESENQIARLCLPFVFVTYDVYFNLKSMGKTNNRLGIPTKYIRQIQYRLGVIVK